MIWSEGVVPTSSSSPLSSSLTRGPHNFNAREWFSFHFYDGDREDGIPWIEVSLIIIKTTIKIIISITIKIIINIIINIAIIVIFKLGII